MRLPESSATAEATDFTPVTPHSPGRDQPLLLIPLILLLIVCSNGVAHAQQTDMSDEAVTTPGQAESLQDLQSQMVAVVRMPGSLPATVPSPLNDWLEGRAAAILPAAIGGGVVIESGADGRLLVLTSSRLLGTVSGNAMDRPSSREPAILIVTYDGLQLPARLLASHPLIELAVLEAEVPATFRTREQPVARFSERAMPGIACVLISDPIGLVRSGASAIGTATIRRQEWRPPAVATPSAISLPPISTWRLDREREPAVTGCPIFDQKGDCIGIVAEPTVNDLAGTGLPVIDCSASQQSYINDLRSGYELEYGWLGLMGERANPEQLTAIPIDYFPQPHPVRTGVRLTGVPEMSAHDEPELSVGQIVFAVNGQRVRNSEELAGLVAQHRPGESIVLTLWKPDLEMVDQVTLTTAKTPLPHELAGRFTAHRLPLWRGLRVGFPEAEFSTDSPGFSRLRMGVQVTDVERGSPAARVGLTAGDLIEKVGDRLISTPQEFLEAVELWDDETPLTLSGKTPEVFVPAARKEP